ncbi:MAG: SLAC1 anion channel family protein [Deferribacterales bacterium]
MSESSKLKFFPVTFFATVMGLAGFTIALGKYFEVNEIHMPLLIKGMTIITTLWFFFLGFVYLLKYIKYPEEVKKDFRHPIKINFIPTFSISLILFSITYENMLPTVAYIFWVFGSILHFLLLLLIINRWVFSDFKINLKNPSWFIPVIGPILIPISGVNFSVETSWFFYSIGIVLWLPMFGILLYRLIFNDPMPEKLLPTFFILLAPPAVAFISYVKLTNGIDNFAKVLVNFGIFTFFLLLTFLPRLFKIKFFLSWWAYTFPMAAFTISLVLYAKMTKIALFDFFSTISLILTAVLVILVLIKTIAAALKGEICVEE